MIIDLDYAFLIAVVTWGFIGNSYEFIGKSQGWPVSDWFAGWSTGTIIIVPMVVGSEWYQRGWQRARIALVAGFALWPNHAVPVSAPACASLYGLGSASSPSRMDCSGD